MLSFFKEGKTESYSRIMQSVSECFKDSARRAIRGEHGWAGMVKLDQSDCSIPAVGRS